MFIYRHYYLIIKSWFIITKVYLLKDSTKLKESRVMGHPHHNAKLITSSQTRRFPVKVILLLTVCFKTDRLQES